MAALGSGRLSSSGKGASPAAGAVSAIAHGKSSMPWTLLAHRLWELSWPLSGMEVLTFAKELIITSFVGHLGAFELSSLVLSQTLYNVTGNAPMLGVVVAMETFCGQAFGAKKYHTVGVVLQRALLIVTLFNVFMISFWGQAEWILVRSKQDPDIAHAAAHFTILLAPALLADGVEQCCRRYLAAQVCGMRLGYRAGCACLNAQSSFL
jgi:multidrug resistance protein, MATE family